MNTYQVDRICVSTQDFIDFVSHAPWVGASVLDASSSTYLVTTDGTIQDPNFTLVPVSNQRIAQMKVQVDKECDEVYAVVPGFRATEYLEAEAESLEFRSRGYADPVPQLVGAYAAGKGLTPAQSADYTIYLSKGLRPLVSALRFHRTRIKEALDTANSDASVDAIMQEWSFIINDIKIKSGI